MSRSDDFYDSVNMHSVSPENLSLGANSIALGDVHAGLAQMHKKMQENASIKGNQGAYNLHGNEMSQHSINASKAYGKTITPGSRTASFQYSEPNVDYLS